MVNNEYFVSIVIPNYNYGNYIGETIQSVLDQTYRNFEIVVVDDGSTDNSVEVVHGFGDKVRLIEQKNQHLSAARNTGIRAAKGNWIAFLDSDDLWHPRKLEFQIEALKNNQSWFFVGANALGENDYPDYDVIKPVFRETKLEEFLVYTPMSGSDALVKKSCFDEVGFFDTSLRSSEDREMWLRLSTRYCGGVVDVPLWRYRKHSAQMNRDVQTILSTHKKVIQKYFRAHNTSLSVRRMAWAHYYYSAALSHRDDGNDLFKAFAYGIGSLICAPENYHPSATFRTRLRSLVVTMLRILHLNKREYPSK